MKILYLSQYFPPEMGAPAARVYELSREWARLGHDVTVLTGFPNHPTGVIPPEYRGSLVRREEVEGIHLVRAPIYAAANKDFVRRAANYLSFGASAGLVGPWLTGRPDVLIATSPQILTGVAGLWLSAIKRVPFVFEVRDLWPRSIVEVGAMRAGSAVVRALEQVERLLYRRADHIVSVTDSFVPEIVAHGGNTARISVVTNGVDLELFRPQDQAEARRRLGFPSGLLATYIGTHGMAHGLDTVLEAAKLLAREGIRFLLVGEGAEKSRLKEKAARERIENVTFWDQRPREVIADVIAASDVALVLLRDKPLFRTVIPSKIFEFMGAGKAILTTVDGESRQIVERARAGVFSPPENAPALAQTLKGLLADPTRLAELGQAGRAHVETNYSREALAKKYLEVLEDLTSPAES